jgi:hypothetical protein
MRHHGYYEGEDEPEPRPASPQTWLWGGVTVVLVVVLFVGTSMVFRAARQARDAIAARRQVGERQAEAVRQADRVRGGWAQHGAVSLQELHRAFWADAVTAERDRGERPRFTMRVDRVETDGAGGCTATQETGSSSSPRKRSGRRLKICNSHKDS